MKRYIATSESTYEEVSHEFVTKEETELHGIRDVHVQDYDGVFTCILASDKLVIIDWEYHGDNLVDLVIPKHLNVWKNVSGIVQFSRKEVSGFGRQNYGGTSPMITSAGKLKSVTINHSINLYGNRTFKDCGNLESVYINDVVTTPTTLNSTAYMFENCFKLKDLHYNINPLKIWATNTFANCRELVFEIKSDITTLGARAFYLGNINNQNNQITLQDRDNPITLISAIGEQFHANRGIDTTFINKLLLHISATVLSLFLGCGITEVTIPENITSIVFGTFMDCTSLEEVYLLSSTPPTLGHVNAFQNNHANRKFYIPSGSLSAYESATNWSSFAGQFVEV